MFVDHCSHPPDCGKNDELHPENSMPTMPEAEAAVFRGISSTPERVQCPGGQPITPGGNVAGADNRKNSPALQRRVQSQKE